MDITNKTAKPISVPLPGGKKLFLAPGKSGQVSPKALEHPPLVKLLESGVLVSAGGGEHHKEVGISKISPAGWPATEDDRGDAPVRRPVRHFWNDLSLPIRRAVVLEKLAPDVCRRC